VGPRDGRSFTAGRLYCTGPVCVCVCVCLGVVMVLCPARGICLKVSTHYLGSVMPNIYCNMFHLCIFRSQNCFIAVRFRTKIARTIIICTLYHLPYQLQSILVYPVNLQIRSTSEVWVSLSVYFPPLSLSFIYIYICVCVCVCNRFPCNIIKTNSMDFSSQVNYTDWTTITGRRILVTTFADRRVSRGQSAWISTAVNLTFIDWSRYFCFK
jgi:hypothetical protein